MKGSTVIQGRRVGPEELARIRELLAEHGDWHRTRLSRELCALWGWRNAAGRPKDMACRSLLLRLEALGCIRLPARRAASVNGHRHRSAPVIEHAQHPIDEPLRELLPVDIRLVESSSRDGDLLRGLVAQYHYLGLRSAAGENVRYLVRDRRGRRLGCLWFAAAAWRCKDRDRFTGSCYRAANWLRVGQTTGRTRNDVVNRGPVSSIKTLSADVFGVQLSTGQLTKITARKVSAALAAPYEELRAALPKEHQLGIDETGHKDDGQRHWTWCFRARSFILFLIASSRGSEVLEQTLGTAFAGVINCDYFSAYRKFMNGSSAIMQFCLAHLIRDVKFLSEQNDKVTRSWAKRMLKGFEELFRLIHRREELPERRFQTKLERCRDTLVRQFKSAPDRPGVRDLRQRWSERIWTVLSTCRLQRRSAFEFLSNAIHAFLLGEQAPSLLPRAP